MKKLLTRLWAFMRGLFRRGLSRRDLLDIEEELRTAEQVQLPVEHFFGPGLYARAVFIPAGTVLSGRIHKHANLNIVAKGLISVKTEEGEKHLRAPSVLVSPAGTKRIGLAHEDTVWITVHATTETDIEKIERELVADSYEEFEEHQLRAGGL